MKQKPCDYCGETYHSPCEDGLVECRNLLREQRDELRDALLSVVFYEWGRTGDEDDPRPAIRRAATLGAPQSAPWRNAAALLSEGSANGSVSPKGSP